MILDDGSKATPAALGRLVGVSRQRAAALRDSGTVRGDTLAEWVASYCAHLREQAGARSGAGLTAARARKAAAEAEIRELDLAERRGELLRRDEALATWQGIVATARQRLRAVPSRVAPQLLAMADVPAIHQLLLDEIDLALTELADDRNADA